MKSKRLGCVLALVAGMAAGSVMAADNMLFHGALVAEPCTLKPGDEDIRLDFGTVIDKYLYANGRTPTKPFTLTLQDCDLSLGQTVKITFSGNKSLELPDLLALDGGSQASGIALGLETAEGKPVALNKPSQEMTLASGSTSLALQVYVQGEPTALAQKSIGLGAFSAVATFGLEYE
ncbi:TPA: fimbrial protein [Serratia marcescens]|jgi:type 1 fimbria pilin|uniref:Type 1 fimbrial protein n=2 Tax=Serratia marcescens TaxID=615 RepID=A0A5C7C3V6_SERMA|nr:MULTISPECIES: fimbrial protein [Serratia]ELA7783025.1 type 1 fimbrial protein [Serratia marcescens]MBH3014937.1 type 1 fimbrial protein [Serratia marcescens]MBH3129494.1 type 1 fimbrial protein [Serratia marcescens]MBN5251379.1 type 1 fimbrial protein [Serratia marcescens]MBN5256953.1 type 1 fimbrial protein [Serratia marcescens]